MQFVDVKQFATMADGTRRYGWVTISADNAVKLAEPRMRCPECKGAVALFRRSADGSVPNRAEHKKKNPGCSLADGFKGVRQLATNPIEPDEESVPVEFAALASV